MRLCLYIIVAYYLLNTPWRVTSSVRDKKWLLSHVFLHQNLPLCSQVTLTPGYLTPCHVRSAEDEAALPCLLNKHCGNYVVSTMNISCSDGTLTKTCMPRSVSPERMLCACLHGNQLITMETTWHGQAVGTAQKPVNTQVYTGSCVIRPLMSASLKNTDWSRVPDLLGKTPPPSTMCFQRCFRTN